MSSATITSIPMLAICSDDGTAMTFKPFFSTKTGGTGLGLPLTHQIITEHDGQIHCESVPGRGTTFVIELPIN